MTIRDVQSHPDEAGIEALLHEVGAREEPAPEVAREIYNAVHAEWQALVQQRQRARRRVVWGVAASFACIVLIATFSLRMMTAAVPFATVAHVEGTLLAAPRDTAWATRDVGAEVLTGETVQTDDRTRAALRLPAGVSLRLDHNTTVRMLAADRLQLDAGAVYIDAPLTGEGLTGDGDSLIVQAHAAEVRHLGTQYSVRTRADEVEVSVREGLVVVSNAAGRSTAQAGELLRMTAAGVVSRATIAPTDPSWAWAAAAAPAFDIDNQPLAAFLHWASRESGRPLVYASGEAQALAQTVRLRGSIAGLDLDTALAATLSTTELRRIQTDDGSIGIAVQRGSNPIDSTSAERPTR